MTSLELKLLIMVMVLIRH